MKTIIGIMMRPSLSNENNELYTLYKDISVAINYSGGIPIGILPGDNFYNIINLCDGIIFQGGDNFTIYEKEYLKYVYNKNIPTLGICLGMQLMGVLNGASEISVKEHKQKGKDYVHKVIINKDSKLYSILGDEELWVNSRHKSAIINPKIKVSAFSEDGVVEAIEDNTKLFYMGVQWHPENMIEYDENSQKLFNYFVKVCRENKKIIL